MLGFPGNLQPWEGLGSWRLQVQLHYQEGFGDICGPGAASDSRDLGMSMVLETSGDLGSVGDPLPPPTQRDRRIQVMPGLGAQGTSLLHLLPADVQQRTTELLGFTGTAPRSDLTVPEQPVSPVPTVSPVPPTPQHPRGHFSSPTAQLQ